MIETLSLFAPTRLLIEDEATCKKQVLIKLAETLQQAIPDAQADELFIGFCARERLGSTAVGQGVAIPHIRSEFVTNPLAALLKLNHAVDFAAVDETAVDLVCGLVVPEQATEQHLQILAQLATLFNDSAIRQALRRAEQAEALWHILKTHYEKHRCVA